MLPTQIARLYGMHTGGRGAGQCIGLIQARGGYDPADLADAFAAMQLPVPQVAEVNVGAGHNTFGIDLDADKEVALDLQVAGAVAPEARLALYFTDASDPGLTAAMERAVDDEVHRPSVIVTTWGEAEARWPPATRRQMEAALARAADRRITVIAASGDDLATDGVMDGKAHVDYPASSARVLACGGTTLILDGNGALTGEEVWNTGLRGTGGGISDVYGVPPFQASVSLPPSANGGRRGRGVPDVAAAADEFNGYTIVVRRSTIVTGGTSAAAPLWAGFIALLNEGRGSPLGFVNELFYRNPTWFRPVVTGDNRPLGSPLGYDAGPGWSACTGLGTPDGRAIVAALTAVA